MAVAPARLSSKTTVCGACAWAHNAARIYLAFAGGRGLVSSGFASRDFLMSRLISRQVKSSVYVGEKVSDPTQMVRSAAGNVDQFLVSSARVRCSLARQLVNLSPPVWVIAIAAAARQLAVTSQLGTPSVTAARVRRAEASVGQNEMPRAEAAAMAIINRRNMTICKMACNLWPFVFCDDG